MKYHRRLQKLESFDDWISTREAFFFCVVLYEMKASKAVAFIWISDKQREPTMCDVMADDRIKRFFLFLLYFANENFSQCLLDFLMLWIGRRQDS